MTDTNTGQSDEDIVANLLKNLPNQAPIPRQRPGVGQAIAGTISDALMNRARVMAGGLPQQGAFQQQIQRLTEEDEADQRDYLKAQRDIESRIRIGVAEGRLREQANVRAEKREGLRIISEEERAAKRAQEQRNQQMDEALNRSLIEHGAIDDVAGDFRQMPFEERAKLLSKSMGARTPAAAYEQFINSGLSGNFRIKSIDAFSDGTYAPTLVPISDAKEGDVAGRQELIEQLAAAGIPRETIAQRAEMLGVDPNVATVLGDLSDSVRKAASTKAKVAQLNDLETVMGDEDPDMAGDIGELRKLVESNATAEDYASFYSNMVMGARAAIEAKANNADDPGGRSAEYMAKYLARMRQIIRQYSGYEMPDVSLLPMGTGPSHDEGGGEEPAEGGSSEGVLSGAAKGVGRAAKDFATGEMGSQMFGGGKPKKANRDFSKARIKK